MENSNLQEGLSVSDIRNFLNRRLGEKEADELMKYVNGEIEKNVKVRVEVLQNEIALWRTQLKSDFATKEDADVLKKKLFNRVSKVEGTIILWGFVFWATLIFAFYIINRFVL